VIHFHTTKARKFENYCGVKYIGIDDKSYKKNHKYATIIVDVENKKVISVIKGRDYNAMKEFVDDFILHGGVANNIQISTCDMSLVFRKSLKYYFKNTKIIIDKFHVFKHLNDAVNDTRRMESKDNKSLKRSRYLFLKSELSLNEKQILKRDILLNLNPLTNSAYSCKLELEKIYNNCQTYSEAYSKFVSLIELIDESNIQPLKDFASLLKNNLHNICEYFDNRYTNAILEGFNSRIQECRYRAKGFRNFD
jgi:transposase